MADLIERLKTLQSLDTQLYQFERQQQAKPRELEEFRHQVEEQQEQLKEAEDRLKAIQLAHKEKEVDLQTREGNIKKLQGQLHQVKTNKEYTAMQHEINAARADSSLLEDAILKLLEDIEVAMRARDVQKKRLEEKQAWFRQEDRRIQGELQQAKEAIGRLRAERSQNTPGIPEEALVVYDRVLKVRNGLALVPLSGETCGGCHQRLPPQVVNEVYLKAKLVTCEACNRILYLNDAAV